MNDNIEALERLARLKQDGAISDAEFQEEKRKVLQGGGSPQLAQEPSSSFLGKALKTIFITCVVLVTLVLVAGQFANDIDLAVEQIPAGDGRILLLVKSQNDEPLRIDRLLVNGRADEAGCDFRSAMNQKNRQLYEPTIIKDEFPNGQTVRMGEGINIQVFACGSIEKIEVTTDKGTGTYTF